MPTNKARPEARYVVNLSLQARDIAKAGAAIKLKVHASNGLLGTIEIGQGTFGWRKAHGKLGIRRISWARPAKFMERNAG
jgi:hypothetical protein